MKRIITGAFVLLTTSFAFGQQRTLKPSEAIPIQSLRAAPIISPLCDGEGKLYFRFYLPPSGDGSWVEVSSTGKASTFEIPNGYGHEDVVDAQPGPTGLYLLLQKQSGPKAFKVIKNSSELAPEELAKIEQQNLPETQFSIVVVDERGQEKSAQKLEVNFWPRRIAVFNSGNLLIIGDRESKNGNVVPATVIVDSYGRVLKELSLVGDIEVKDASLPSLPAGEQEKLDPAKKNSLRNAEFLLQLSRSILQPGDDGRIYLARSGTGNNPIYAIRESGEVERLMLKSPRPNISPSAIRISHGTILLFYALPKKNPKIGPLPKIFSIWDLRSREQIAEYFDESTELGFALGCYEPGKVTFLKSTRDNGLELVTAMPR